jgi:glycosyltransferase involved in cell wall biosynthesis
MGVLALGILKGANLMKKKVSIIIPVYYNASSLPYLFPRLLGLSDAKPGYDFEYIFVDDGSGDNSFELLAELAEKDARVRVIKLSRNFGANAAVMAGLHYITGDCAVTISADLQDPPETIIAMLQRWEAGKTVVLAAREDREDPLVSRLLSGAFYWLFRRLAIKEMPAKGCDIALVDRKVADMLIHMGEKNPYLIGLVLWLGFDRDIVYYKRQKRKFGKSRWTFAKKIKYFIDALVAFTYAPMRFVSGLGMALALVGLVGAMMVIWNKAFHGVPLQGWASLMVVILTVSGVQMLTLGIFGEYLWRNFDETRKRPSFVIDQVIAGARPDEKELVSSPSYGDADQEAIEEKLLQSATTTR